MDEEQANLWFCDKGAPIHTVFDRERPYVTVEIPLLHSLKPHKKLCGKWMASHGKAGDATMSNATIGNSKISKAAFGNATISDLDLDFDDDGNE